jgi:hypothetical protein
MKMTPLSPWPAKTRRMLVSRAGVVALPPTKSTELSAGPVSASQLLTVADALKSLQDAVQVENILIASRVTWYVTSQAFLLTAYATSWNANFGWPSSFHLALPIAAIVLSGITFMSIYAANGRKMFICANRRIWSNAPEQS